jgi:hypothetical protein
MLLHMIEARAIDLPQLSLTPLPTNQPTEIEFIRCHPSTPRLATPPTAAHKPPPALYSLHFAQSLEDRRCFPKAQQPDHLPFLEKKYSLSSELWLNSSQLQHLLSHALLLDIFLDRFHSFHRWIWEFIIAFRHHQPPHVKLPVAATFLVNNLCASFKQDHTGTMIWDSQADEQARGRGTPTQACGKRRW